MPSNSTFLCSTIFLVTIIPLVVQARMNSLYKETVAKPSCSSYKHITGSVQRRDLQLLRGVLQEFLKTHDFVVEGTDL